MFAVCISLGSTSAYVSVSPIAQQQDGGAPPPSGAAAAAPIKIVANSAGHRNTPVAAALTEQEVLFGENAMHTFARQPQRVVPYLFAYSAAAAAVADAGHATTEAERARASNLLAVVEKAARVKYQGHCGLEERERSNGIPQHGFSYEVDGSDGEPSETFISAEDLFVQFLNYLKTHSIDAACGLVAGGADAAASNGAAAPRRPLVLTVVVPRGAIPGAAGPEATAGAGRAAALDWLADAVRASQLGEVSQHTSILFSDEAALLAFDSAPRVAPRPRPHFLLPSNAAPVPAVAAVDEGTPAPLPEADVLVVDWGAQALHLSLHRTVGGTLVVPRGGVPFMSCAAGARADAEGHYCSAHPCSGGDVLDVALADKVAANYMVVNRRVFQSAVPNMRSLSEFLSPSAAAGAAASGEARRIIAETIPSRAMRRLRLLMGDKKIALNTNPQATSVTVEMEAFYEGMDLLDSQSLSRNKFEAAVLGEWACVDRFEAALTEFLHRHQAALGPRVVSHVLLTGGMCQIPSIVAGLRRALRNPRSAAVRSALRGGAALEVMEASLLGNGVAADELFAVGGCLHSYHLGRMLAAKEGSARRLAKAQKKRRSVAGRIEVETLRGQQAAAAAAWTALTTVEAAPEQEDAAEAAVLAETVDHAFILGRSVYLLTGEESAETLSNACETTRDAASGSIVLPVRALTALFVKGTVLPSRVACSLGKGADDAVLYLFADEAGRTDDADPSSVTVKPLTDSGVRVSGTVDDASTAFVVFTLRTNITDDGNHTVAITVQRVISRTDALPQMLTPANATEVTEVILQ